MDQQNGQIPDLPPELRNAVALGGGEVQEAIRQFGQHMAKTQGTAVILLGLQVDGRLHVRLYTPGGIGQIGDLMWQADKVLGQQVKAN